MYEVVESRNFLWESISSRIQEFAKKRPARLLLHIEWKAFLFS